MENKGLVKLFAILFGLVSIYQLSFTFVAGGVESDAEIEAGRISTEDKNYVKLRQEEVARYLDSVGTEQVYNIGIADFTYNEVKEKELNKGLDLKGGINVILQISVKDILKGLTNYTKDSVFNETLALTDKASKNSDATYLELFFDIFEKLETDTKLASPTIFANKTLSDEINIQMSNSDVRVIITKKVDESIVSAFEVLRKRIDKFGVTQPNIQRLGKSGRILVELPGAKDVERVKTLLQSTAQLEFWFAYKNSDVIAYIVSANEKLKELLGDSNAEEDKVNQVEETKTSEIDSLLTEVETDSLDTKNKLGPIFELAKRQSYNGSPVIASFLVKDTATINSYFRMSEVKRLLPDNLRYMKLVWGKPEKSTDLTDLYAIRYNRDSKPDLSGGVIVDAYQTYDMSGAPAVSMQMNGKGARVWEEMTGKAYKENSNIAIVLDDIVYSAPGVSKGPISGGSSEISGNFTLNEAIDLANVLRAGKLPASSEIIQSEIVGPSLGQEAIDNGINSFLIAMLIVLLWMIVYYGFSGAIADIALVFNIVLIFGILAGLGAVLTLPGIAGVILTIGMSVDANVIIFERIREELAKGKGQKQAITDGFKSALSSILDANITTGLTALILLIFGTGPIRGFATTLLIGIATSLFTAIYVSRLFIDSFLDRGKKFEFTTSVTKNLFRNISVKFLEKRKLAYVVSSIIIVLSIGSLFTKGLNQGVDFIGGRSYQVRFNHPVNPSEVASKLANELGSAEVKTFGGDNQLKITTKYKVDEEGTDVDQEINDKLYSAFQSIIPEDITKEQFVNGSSQNIGIMSSIKVGPTIADDIKISAIWAILGSLFVVFLYILLRFRKWQFSLGAVAAVFHDVLIVLGIFSLTYDIMPFSMEIDQAFIAAILTIIGYSLNDTVIVFDRIREYKGDTEKKGLLALFNRALSSTLSRTLNTSLTTLVVLITIFIFGGEALRGFIFAMILGVIVGTYSSLFIASPITHDLSKSSQEDKK